MFSRVGIFLLGVLMSFSVTTAWSASITKLSNGLTVLVQEDSRFPLASLRLYVHAGSAYETPQQAGISHLLEHMVFKGTESRPKGSVAGDIENIGGYINAATSFDYTVYMTDVPSLNWKLGMSVLNDMAFHPTIDPNELESEKKVVIAELERGEDSPGSRLFKRLQAQALGNTSYERPIIGYRDTVNSFSRDDILAYIAKYYQPQSMLLVVAGDVQESEVIAEAEKLFGEIPNTHVVHPPAAIETKGMAGGPVVHVEHGAWNKVYLGAVIPVPGFTDTQTNGLEVLAHLLGGDKTSRFYRTFKYEKQLVDDISVSLYGFERVGLLYITAVLDPENVEAFWKDLMKSLHSIKSSDFTDAELDRAKLNIEDSLFRTKETLSGLASKLGMFQFFYGGMQGEKNYLEELRHISRSEIQELITTYLRPERLQATLLVPEKTQLQPDILEKSTQKHWPIATQKNTAATVRQVSQKPETIELGEGRTLVLLPDPTLPYVSIDMTFEGGDALLTPDDQGLAALTARGITKGTTQYTASEMEIFQSDRASVIGARAGKHTFTVSAMYPQRFAADIRTLFQEVIASPAFDAKEIEREKNNQLAAITAREDQPLGLAFRHIFSFLFENHYYAFFHQGMPERVTNFTPQDVKSYWKKQVHQPWVMAVCGDFDKDTVIAMAKNMPHTTPTKRTEEPPMWGGEKEKTFTLEDRNQAHYMMVFKTVPLAHEDTPKLKLLQTILSGQSGLLFNELRDKQGLGYTVTAFQWQSDLAGFMAFYIGTVPEKEHASLAGFTTIAKQVKTDLLPEDLLRRGKNLIRGNYYRDHQSIGSRSSEAASLLSSGFPLSHNRDVIDHVEKITAEDLRTIARKYLDTENAYIMRVTP